jgi:hypothetical protein
MGRRKGGTMGDGQWKRDYEAIVRESFTRGELEHVSDARERRDHPRFRMRSQHVWIKVQPRFDVVDVSVAGISVYSDFPFKVGETLTITLGKAFSVEASVVECPIVEADAAMLETKYRVQCRFADETVGMQCLVMMKQMDELEVRAMPVPHLGSGG